MTHAAGIRRAVNARPPVRFARAAARRDVLILPRRQCGSFLDPDAVVFQPEIRINVFLVLEMARDDARTIGERQDAAKRREFMRQLAACAMCSTER